MISVLFFTLNELETKANSLNLLSSHPFLRFLNPDADVGSVL